MDNFDNDPEVIQARANAKKRAAKQSKVEQPPISPEQEIAIEKIVQRMLDANAKKSRMPTNKKMDEKLDEHSAMLKTLGEKQDENMEEIAKTLKAIHSHTQKAMNKLYTAIRGANHQVPDKPRTPSYEGSSASSSGNSPTQ